MRKMEKRNVRGACGARTGAPLKLNPASLLLSEALLSELAETALDEDDCVLVLLGDDASDVLVDVLWIFRAELEDAAPPFGALATEGVGSPLTTGKLA